MVPIIRESTNIINVDVSIFDTWQYIFHCCLGNVWQAFESQRESQVLLLSKWCNNGTEILTFLMKFKCIVLHTNVKFCEKLVPRRLRRLSVIIGNGYCLHLMTLFNWRKLLIQRTLPSFLGVMNEGDVHSLSCCAARTPISTRWSSSFLKVFKWI
jgi:hypothetical protein